MTPEELETRVIALELLWLNLADAIVSSGGESAKEYGEAVANSFLTVRLDSGRAVSPQMRLAMEHAARVARRLGQEHTAPDDAG